MRISFVSTVLCYPWGGADTLWTRAAEAASQRGDELQLFVSPAVAGHPRIAALTARGASVHERVAPDMVGGTAARIARKVRSLIRPADPVLAALQSFRPDLILFSLGGTYDLVIHPGWIDWLAASGTPYRLIANWQQEHPVLPEREHALAVRALAGADFVGFVSTRNLENTRSHLLHPLPNARLIQNPLRWQPTDVSPWLASATPILATVSRLEAGKGIQLLLHALAALRGDLPAFHLHLYGQGGAAAYLRRTVEFLGLTPQVTFRGHVQALREIWAENQLLVSPSLEDGVPMTIPEAMLCERPVLATAVGGAEDWLRHGETGFLCPAPTLPLLVDALRSALAARAEWSEMGRRAAVSARAHYRPDDYLNLVIPPIR